MTALQFGAWEPDSAGVDARDMNGAVILQTAKNVYPSKTGYAPIPALAQIATSALPSKCFGLAFARTSAGGYQIFAGTQTGLYKFQVGAWVDYTRVSGGAYNVSADDYWSFTQFGSKLIAVHINDDPQVIDVDTGATAFSALGGTPPRSRYVTVVGDFVVLGCFSTNNLKIRNSAINDTTGWTIGTNLCDEQEFADGGRVTGIAGGEFGYVVQEKAIRRMIFQPGSDTAFRFERVEKEHGAAAGYSVIATINAVFFLSDDGFYAFSDSKGLVPIGGQRVNKWFRSNSDTGRFFSVIAFSDPYAPRIAWAFFNSGGSANFDRLLIYDWQIDRWSYADITAQFWATSVTSGVTLEELDITGVTGTVVTFDTGTDVVNWVGHGFIADGEVEFTTTGTLPIGITTGPGQVYYVKSPTTDTFQLAATPGGSAINLTGSPSGVHTGYNANSIDTDIPFSLDSRVWEGGRPVIGAVDASGRLSFLEDALPLDALLTTSPMQLVRSARANVGSVYPVGVFNDAALAIRVGRRENTKDAVSYTAAVTPSTRTGIARTKASGRVHEIETAITQTTGSLWAHMQGLDVAATPDGAK